MIFMYLYRAGTNTDAENRYLEMLYYQMARYLMISGSREGGLPLNLQGLWNNNNHPIWHSGYTTNINAVYNKNNLIERIESEFVTPETNDATYTVNVEYDAYNEYVKTYVWKNTLEPAKFEIK